MRFSITGWIKRRLNYIYYDEYFENSIHWQMFCWLSFFLCIHVVKKEVYITRYHITINSTDSYCLKISILL